MVEANQSVQQIARQARLLANMSMAVRVLARQRAIKQTKRHLQAQGRRKVWQVPMREIVILANE
jgi:hypothetical protein